MHSVRTTLSFFSNKMAIKFINTKSLLDESTDGYRCMLEKTWGILCSVRSQNVKIQLPHMRNDHMLYTSVLKLYCKLVRGTWRWYLTRLRPVVCEGVSRIFCDISQSSCPSCREVWSCHVGFDYVLNICDKFRQKFKLGSQIGISEFCRELLQPHSERYNCIWTPE